MEVIRRTIDVINEWTGKVFSFLWIVVVLVISYEVAVRATGVPADPYWKWCHETVVFLAGGLYMLGGAYTLYKRKHISKDLVYNRCSRRGRAILDLISFPFFLLFMGALLLVGVDFAWESTILGRTSGTFWNPRLWPLMWTIPVAAAMMMFIGLARFADDLAVVIQRKNPE